MIGSKGTIPSQIPVNLLVILAMFAIGAAVMLLVIGRWLDITGIKYKFETQRNAMNLIQLIVSNSPVVKRDSVDIPSKLILDAGKLSEYQNDAGIGTESPSSRRDTWETCCDFLGFDYNFTARNLVTGENWTIGNLIFNPLSDCYPQRIKGMADLPVVIDENGRRDHGAAEIEMARTPLSELSFWLSQAFLRASWDDYWDVYSEEPYHVKIPLDPEIKCVKILPDVKDTFNLDEVCVDNYMRVCVILNDGRETCKNFVCETVDSQGENVVFNVDWDHKYSGDCFDVLITVNENEVRISYPGDCS